MSKNIFFTSDLHLFHSKVIDFCNRPTTPEHHNEWVIDKLNSLIKPEDEVYSLGDLSLTIPSYLELVDTINQLNGSWKFVKGNHDNHSRMIQLAKDTNNEYLGSSYIERKIQRKANEKSTFFVLCHFPIESWNGMSKGSLHLHGHVHNSLTEAPKKQNRYNVCFDLDFRPFHIDEILSDNLGEFKNSVIKEVRAPRARS